MSATEQQHPLRSDPAEAGGERPARSTARRGPGPLPIAAFVACLLLSAAAALGTWEYERGTHRAEAGASALRAADQLTRQVDATGATLLGVRGVFAASRDVQRAEFDSFAQVQMTPMKLLSLTWAPRVAARARTRFERAQGAPIVVLDPGGRTRRAPVGAEHFPLLYLARGAALTGQAVGHDIASSPANRRTLALARDSGLPVLEATAEAGPEGRVIPLTLAVYRKVPVPDDVAGRREALIGYAGAVYRLQDVVAPLGALVPSPARLEILDEGVPVAGRHVAGAASQSVDLGGRRWTVRVSVVPPDASFPLAVGGVGLIVSLLLGLVFLQARRREREGERARGELAGERDHSSQMLATMQDGLLVIGTDGAIADVNDALCELTGFERGQLVGRRAPFPFWPQLQQHQLEESFGALRAEDRQEWDVSLSHADGSRRDGILTAACLRDGAGVIRGYLSTIKDVSDRREAERRLRESEATQRRLAAEHAALRRVATAVAGEGPPEELFDLVAREAAELLGVEHGAVIRFAGRAAVAAGSWCMGPSLVGEQVPFGGEGALARVRHTGQAAHVGDRSTMEDGLQGSSAAPIRVAGRLWGAVFAATTRPGGLAPGSEARLDEFAGLVAMAIAGAETRRELARQASTDGLTGLVNHRIFHERLAAEVERAQRHGRALSLVLFDIDHFKLVNDRFGHQSGDAVLAEVSRRAKHLARPQDILARIGGEEFALIVTEADGVAAYATAERVRRAVGARPFDGVGAITLSAGVCDLEEAGSGLEMMRRADAALYWAKGNGRDVTARYSPEQTGGGSSDGSGRLATGLDRLLESARSELSLEVAYLVELTPQAQIVRHVSGDGTPFGIVAGKSLERGVPTFCTRVAAGELPSLITDARAEAPGAGTGPGAPQDAGCYVGVPVHLPDGRLYGVLVATSRHPEPGLGESDVRFMRALASMAGEQVQAEESTIGAQRARRQQLERVLAGEDLEMVFQPIVDLRSGEVVGHEALARFSAEPVRAPDVWFAEAALEGLGVELEVAAIRRALEGLPRLPLDTYLSLNVSPETFLSPELQDVLAGVPGNRLALELTEHARVDDYGALRAMAQRMRRLGIRLMVDDAGAGFSSFKHILDLAPDTIKLDISLTRDIHLDPVRRALAASLVSFAYEIDACIVAEGIESQAELDVVAALGVGFGQGYFLGRPEPLPAPVREPSATSV